MRKIKDVLRLKYEAARFGTPNKHRSGFPASRYVETSRLKTGGQSPAHVGDDFEFVALIADVAAFTRSEADQIERHEACLVESGRFTGRSNCHEIGSASDTAICRDGRRRDAPFT